MDSEMFIKELINNINSKLSHLKFERNQNYFGWKNEKEKLFKEYIKKSEAYSHYEIDDLFYIYFIHKKICKNNNCNNVEYYFDKTIGLKLNFQNIKNKNDLITLIKEKFIQKNEQCERCGYNSSIEISIAKLPRILIIPLQKAERSSIVNYHEVIDIKEFVDIELCKKDNYLYQLFATNNHLGPSPNSGHYFSEINIRKLGHWYSFNDEYICAEHRPKIDYFNYILFYKNKSKKII